MPRMPRTLALVLAATVLTANFNGAGAQTFATVDERGIPTIAPLLDTVTDAVVNIAVVSQQPVQDNPLFNDPFFQQFFDFLDDEFVPQLRPSAGSGVIVDADKGYVLTNAHVIENEVDVTVTLKDRRNFEATLLGMDSATDIALLQIEPVGLSDLPLGDATQLKVGDLVVAVGNPFGLGQTVTSGIISALGRSGINPEGFEDFIQTDASINPGNSGGALVTLDGKLVGINSAIIAPSGGNVGIGFAVPINMAKTVMDQLIEFGEVRRGQLGVSVQDLTPDLAEALGLSISRGAVVVQVQPDTPAARAGLRAGDIVTSVDGTEVGDASDLRNRIGLTPQGKTIKMTVLRDGKETAITATLQPQGPSMAQTAGQNGFQALDGAQFEALGPEMPGYGDVVGVSVTAVAPDSPAQAAGLRQGDVIMAVNNQPVLTLDDLDALLPRKRATIALTIYRNGSTIYLIVR